MGYRLAASHHRSNRYGVLAHGIGLPREAGYSASVIAYGARRPTFLGAANGRRVRHNGGVGFDAHALGWVGGCRRLLAVRDGWPVES
jgi:hypothetical protein